MLREAINEFKVVGVLSEIDLRYGSYMKAGVPTEFIGGDIKVKVDNGDGTSQEVPINFFANKYKKDGGISPAYESIEKVMKEYVSIAAAGSEAAADKVSIIGSKNTNIKVNDFIGRNGEVVSDPRLNASFVNKITGELHPEATFDLECMINTMHRVCDSDGVELDPAKLELQVVVPIYGERVQVMKLYVTNPEAITYIESNWEIGSTYKVHGNLNFNARTVERVEEQAFGEPIKKVYTNSVKEFIITSGSDAYDDEMAFNINDVQEAVARRKAEIEQKKNTATKTPVPAAAGKATLDLGF